LTASGRHRVLLLEAGGSSSINPLVYIRGQPEGASIFPAVTSGNTNAPTTMVGEKVANLFLRGAR
jgi:choline dehydrogenase-like flavoprotein